MGILNLNNAPRSTSGLKKKGRPVLNERDNLKRIAETAGDDVSAKTNWLLAL